MEEEVSWQAPTIQSLYEAFHFSWKLLPSYQDDDNNFPILYDRQIGPEGEHYEVLPGLWGKVSNYYVTHIGSLWHGSQVWINNGHFKAWYAAMQQQHEEGAEKNA